MQAYDKYKDSGVEWLGEIPEHWVISNCRYYLNILTDYTANGSFGDLAKNVNYSDYVGYSRVIRLTDLRENLNNSGIYVDEHAHTYLKKSQLVGGEVLIANVGAYAGFAIKMPYMPYKATLGPNMFLTKWNNNFLNDDYIVYTLNSISYNKYLSVIANSAAQPKLNKDNIRGIRLLLPPLPEQQAIAAFLDEKCRQLDEAVRIKQHQIEKLKELRQITIHNAVTKGINPDAEMKDTGIDWIGEIPKHWEVKRLKNVTSKIGSGITPNGGGQTYLDEGIPLLRSQNVHFDKIDLSNVAFISRKTYESMANSIVKKWDVLLNITGGSIGRCNVVAFDLEMNVNQHVCIIRPLQIKPEFLNYLLASEVGQSQIWYFQQGGGREGLNFQNLKNFDLSYPPLAEQQEIVTYLEEKTSKIDKAIALKTEQISKLNEYKQSLINEVVTGKVKVTN